MIDSMRFIAGFCTCLCGTQPVGCALCNVNPVLCTETGTVHSFRVKASCTLCHLNVGTLLVYFIMYFITEPSSKSSATNTLFDGKTWQESYQLTDYHNTKALLSLASLIDSAITLSAY